MNSNGAIILYDVTDNESYGKAKMWIQELRNILGNTVCFENFKLKYKLILFNQKKVCIALVGNKCDLIKSPHNNPMITEAEAYCRTLDKAVHYLTSAKLNQGLDEMFVDLTRRMNEYQRLNARSPSITSFGNRALRITDEEETNTDDQTETRRCSC